MLYVKNVPTVERVIRFLMGLTLLGGAWPGWARRQAGGSLAPWA